MFRLLALTVFIACVFFAATSSVRAEQVEITSGFISGFAAGNDNPYTVNFGQPSFSLVQQQAETYVSNLNNVPLTPGQTVTSIAHFALSTSDGFLATVTHNGITYFNVRPSGSLVVAPISITIPLSASFGSTITAPFTLSGTLSFTDLSNQPIFSVDVVGSGFVTFNFNGISGPGTVALGTVTYNFTSVPEPVSLLLFGSGIVAVGSAIRKRHKFFS